jgi:hypothetical protein
MNFTRYAVLVLVFSLNSLFTNAQNSEPANIIDFRFSPRWWQTAINLPESPRKTLVGKNGQLMYEYPATISDPKISQSSGFSTLISFTAGENDIWKSQQLLKPEVPMVITQKELKGLEIKEEIFTVAPLLFGSNNKALNDFLGTAVTGKVTGVPGNDIVIVTIENTGTSSSIVTPIIRINTSLPSKVDTAKGKVFLADFLRVVIPYPVSRSTVEPARKNAPEKSRSLITLSLNPFQIAAGEKLQLTIGVSHGYTAIDCPNNLQQALHLQKQSISWWENLSLPYNKISVPDERIQSLINASVRNLFQTADLEKGLIALNTGPSINRQFFISDAPFIIDALTMLNQTDYARSALEHMFSLQKSDGSFQQQEKDWKQTGMALWAISNYARLTGDKQWVESVWPKLEKGYNYLIELTKSTQNSKSAFAGLLPPGSGSENQGVDFVNNYWALAGLNSAITTTRWASRHGQAIKWQSLYDDYYKTFLASINGNMKKDQFGNSYLPVRATSDKKTPPQRSQWAFLNAVYPGKIFDMNHPLINGNMKMLERVVKEGLLPNTGWMNNGIVLTTASDYAHALQWTGKAREATDIMYAMTNHAAPNLAWFEQQPVRGVADTLTTGDMPNSRVSAEFIRLVRHLIVMERNNDLHLFEGIPTSWTKPGMEIKLDDVLTDFGPLTLKLKISDDGKWATLEMNLNTINRRPPQRTILHLDGIAGNPAVMELDLKPNLQKVFKLE